jgi:tetratricopeptide (TPR) repeat protein
MRLPWISSRILLPALVVCTTAGQAPASERTIIAEAHYLMADSDTLAQAEERVLRRAQRRAVEEAGIYLESTFQDLEQNVDGRSVQRSSLEIRTIAAAITKTDILESRRSFENDRPRFFVRIRAVVDLDHLQEAMHRWRSEQQMAAHFRLLQNENTELKAQLRELQAKPAGVRTLVIEPPGRSDARGRARALVVSAIETPSLRLKLDMTSQAAALDPNYADPLIVRGQTYLRLVSLAYSGRSRPSEYSEYIDNARMDFDRALALDSKNIWALLGQGDVYTWLKRPDEAAQAYEQALALNPFFDVARQRLINLHTTQARRLTSAKQWSQALALLTRLLSQPLPESWIPYKQEAYLLRSEVYQKLNRPTQAIDDLSVILRADPANIRALLSRAKLYREQLQGSLAKDDFERACLLGSAEACEQLP